MAAVSARHASGLAPEVQHTKIPTARIANRRASGEQLRLLADQASPRIDQLRATVQCCMRNEPGVYLMRGSHGEVLYVGKSNRVRTRVLSYFRLPWPANRHARMLRETASIEWEPQPSEFASLLREVRLIRAHLPRYNSRSARPLDRWWVITITRGIAPRLRVQRASVAMRSHNLADIIGPVASRAVIAEALRVLNDALGLRDCSDSVAMHMPDEVELFDEGYPAMQRTPACHRFETGHCLGPCVGATEENAYRERILQARAVLNGLDESPQQYLLREMAVASAAMSYERAGWLRGRLTALEGLTGALERVREAFRRTDCVCAVPGHTKDDRLYLVHHGCVIAEARCADSASVSALVKLNRSRRQECHPPSAHEAVPTLPAPVKPSPRPLAGLFVEHIDEMLLVHSWIEGRQCEAPIMSDSVEGALEQLAAYRASAGATVSGRRSRDLSV